MAQATLYGIANCDTVKRARAWLGDALLPAPIARSSCMSASGDG